jgi:hypothetical protein
MAQIRAGRKREGNRPGTVPAWRHYHGRRQGGHRRDQLRPYGPWFDEPKAPEESGDGGESTLGSNAAGDRPAWWSPWPAARKLIDAHENGHSSLGSVREKHGEGEESKGFSPRGIMGSETDQR